VTTEAARVSNRKSSTGRRRAARCKGVLEAAAAQVLESRCTSGIGAGVLPQRLAPARRVRIHSGGRGAVSRRRSKVGQAAPAPGCGVRDGVETDRSMSGSLPSSWLSDVRSTLALGIARACRARTTSAGGWVPVPRGSGRACQILQALAQVKHSGRAPPGVTAKSCSTDRANSVPRRRSTTGKLQRGRRGRSCDELPMLPGLMVSTTPSAPRPTRDRPEGARQARERTGQQHRSGKAKQQRRPASCSAARPPKPAEATTASALQHNTPAAHTAARDEALPVEARRQQQKQPRAHHDELVAPRARLEQLQRRHQHQQRGAGGESVERVKISTAPPHHQQREHTRATVPGSRALVRSVLSRHAMSSSAAAAVQTGTRSRFNKHTAREAAHAHASGRSTSRSGGVRHRFQTPRARRQRCRCSGRGRDAAAHREAPLHSARRAPRRRPPSAPAARGAPQCRDRSVARSRTGATPIPRGCTPSPERRLARVGLPVDWRGESPSRNGRSPSHSSASDPPPRACRSVRAVRRHGQRAEGRG